MVNKFFANVNKEISTVNRSIDILDEFRQKEHIRKQKPDVNYLAKLHSDLKKILEIIEPNEHLRFQIVSIDFIGLAAIGLEDYCHPIQIQVKFAKNHNGAFWEIFRKYIMNKFKFTGKRFDTIDRLLNKSIEF